jgi:hypothetical protein
MPLSPMRAFIAVVILASLVDIRAFAVEQHLKFESMTDVYTLTFDDSKISVDLVKRIAWLSPFISPDVDDVPFLMTGSQDGREKMIIMNPVESCDTGTYECHHPTLNDRFMRQGEENLAFGATRSPSCGTRAYLKCWNPSGPIC